MPSRRHFAAVLLSMLAAVPAVAQQGKKGSGSSDGAPPQQVFAIAGTYAAAGMNADGSTYTGRVQIEQDGSAVAFAWIVGNSSYSGKGLIDGRIVAVDWGADSPVVYVVMPDGELHGTWDDGRALEKLTPN